jgi:hypothetical protein
VSRVARIAWYRYRATFHDRWGGCLAIDLLVALLGGLSMGAIAGARRTQSFEQGTTWTFVTKHGYLDIALLPDGTRGYDDLPRSATREQLTDAVTILVAALADVIRSKEAAGREKDRVVLPILRQVLERSRKKDRDNRGMER